MKVKAITQKDSLVCQSRTIIKGSFGEDLKRKVHNECTKLVLVSI